jgi:hypothetical protein
VSFAEVHTVWSTAYAQQNFAAALLREAHDGLETKQFLVQPFCLSVLKAELGQPNPNRLQDTEAHSFQRAETLLLGSGECFTRLGVLRMQLVLVLNLQDSQPVLSPSLVPSRGRSLFLAICSGFKMPECPP